MAGRELKTPYYAVIFTSVRTEGDLGYSEMASRMEELARAQDGFLGVESVRDPETRKGITVSYWRDLESIARWKSDLEHQEAQKLGREKWYASFDVKVCRVEREYSLSR